MAAVARIAIQFRLGNDDPNPQAAVDPNADPVVYVDDNDAANGAGWFDTGKKFDRRLTYTGDNYPIPSQAWGEVREVRYGVIREFGGVNSSGGPQHSGRADHKDILVVRNSDKISSHLFKRCCNGMQLKRVVIYDPDKDLCIVAEDCNLTSFEFISDKAPTTRYEISQLGMDQGKQFLGLGTGASQSIGGTRRYEKITILYTKVSMTLGGGPWCGWDTGTETKFDTSDYTMP